MKHNTFRTIMVILMMLGALSGCASKSGEGPPTATSRWVEGKSFAIRVDRFQWSDDETSGLLNLQVDATVRILDSAAKLEELKYLLDFGDHTIGTGNTGYSERDDGSRHVQAHFSVSGDSRPLALVVSLNEERLRIPLH